MPLNNNRHQNATTTTATAENNPFSGETRHHQPPSKPNPKFLSLLLQAFIMTFILSLFFLFVGVAAIIFLHLCIAGGALRHRLNHHRPSSGNRDSSSGYSLDLLKTLPKARFRGSDVCTICLDNILDGEICRVLPNCKHAFHLNCVDKWILKSPICPVCRSSVRVLDNEAKGRGSIDWEHLWSACG